MLTFHSIWTRPIASQGVDEMSLWDFEWLTWLAGLLQAKTQGPTVLVADPRGVDFVKKAGLYDLYDEVVLGLEDIPKQIDPQIFWAAGKLYAIPLLKRLNKHNPREHKICSLDWDCIPWTYPTHTDRAMCLNLEQLDWPWYKDCRPKYERFVPEPVSWKLQPANNGAIIFEKYQDMLAYSSLSIAFMQRFSKAAEQGSYFSQPRHVYGDAMTFAEQQLLPTAVHNSGQRLVPMLQAGEDGFLLENRFMTHLWTTKTLYRAFPEARVHFTNQLVRLLRDKFPNARPILKDKGLHTTQPILTAEENLKWNTEGVKHYSSYKIGVVTKLQGSGSLVDRNIPGVRQLRVGSVVLPGDSVIEHGNSSTIRLEYAV